MMTVSLSVLEVEGRRAGSGRPSTAKKAREARRHSVCLESSLFDEAEKNTGLPGWLVEVYKFYGCKQVFDVLKDDWPERYDEFTRLLPHLDRSLIEAFPNNATFDDEGRPVAFTIRVLPRFIQIYKDYPQKAHRQVTVDGEKIDLRTMVGRVIATPNIANLADACRIWLADLKYERPKARCKVRILLERTIGIRGAELAAYDPHLKAEIMETLTAPAQFPCLRERVGK